MKNTDFQFFLIYQMTTSRIHKPINKKKALSNVDAVIKFSLTLETSDYGTALLHGN